MLVRLLERVREGRSAVLVIRGEAGVGKTALMRYAARQASGFRVAQIAGVEAEMELPFAGLHQLCGPMLDQLDRFPAPQKDTLGIALGLSSGETPDRFLVALATLSLLSEGAEELPLACFVDDAEWLDDASGQVLGSWHEGYWRRRSRSCSGCASQAANVRSLAYRSCSVGGLAEEDARALLATVIPGRLDERVRDPDSRGNTWEPAGAA